AHVAAVDIDAGLAKSTADAVSQLGRRGLAGEADGGDVAAIDAMVRRVIAAFERIDVLVNDAGVTRRAYIMDLTEADWDRIMRVNAKGVFFCLQRVAREMIPRRSGVIINIASIAGKGYAGTSNAIYAASKGGVISLTRTAAQQLAPHNINVNAVCPGTTVTALSDDNVATRARRPGPAHSRPRSSTKSKTAASARPSRGRNRSGFARSPTASTAATSGTLISCRSSTAWGRPRRWAWSSRPTTCRRWRRSPPRCGARSPSCWNTSRS